MKLFAALIAIFVIATAQALFMDRRGAPEVSAVGQCVDNAMSGHCSQEMIGISSAGASVRPGDMDTIGEYCGAMTGLLKCTLEHAAESCPGVSAADIKALPDYQSMKTSIGQLAGTGSARCGRLQSEW